MPVFIRSQCTKGSFARKKKAKYFYQLQFIVFQNDRLKISKWVANLRSGMWNESQLRNKYSVIFYVGQGSTIGICCVCIYA